MMLPTPPPPAHQLQHLAAHGVSPRRSALCTPHGLPTEPVQQARAAPGPASLTRSRGRASGCPAMPPPRLLAADRAQAVHQAARRFRRGRGGPRRAGHEGRLGIPFLAKAHSAAIRSRDESCRRRLTFQSARLVIRAWGSHAHSFMSALPLLQPLCSPCLCAFSTQCVRLPRLLP